MKIQLYNEDCKETMKRIRDGSIDLMLTDPPYGVTANEWDITPNFSELWPEWERILKPKGKWVFTMQMPYSISLISPRLGFFKYELIWDKVSHTNPFVAKYRPLSVHENIYVFSKNTGTFNPQKYYNGVVRSDYGKNGKRLVENFTNKNQGYKRDMDGYANPNSIIRIARESIKGSNESRSDNSKHPTQKPIDLFRYLIKTYSNEGETVYDGYSGSGTTAIACIMEKRNFIGAELNKEYYDAAKKRIDAKLSQPALF